MSLPILRTLEPPSPATLVRYFHQAQLAWARHITEDETRLDVGVALANTRLNRVALANQVLDAALTTEMNPADAVALADAHFTDRGGRCLQWAVNPSAPPIQTQPLEEHFRAEGFTPNMIDIFARTDPKAFPLANAADIVRIIPARASYRHTETLHRQMIEHRVRDGDGGDATDNEQGSIAQWLEAAEAHLDDSHFDALLALQNAEPVAFGGVLSMGEVGLIEQVFVTEFSRRQGIGTVVLTRLLEICVRSVFKHLLMGIKSENVAATSLATRFGFKTIGTMTVWTVPQSGKNLS